MVVGDVADDGKGDPPPALGVRWDRLRAIHRGGEAFVRSGIDEKPPGPPADRAGNQQAVAIALGSASTVIAGVLIVEPQMSSHRRADRSGNTHLFLDRPSESDKQLCGAVLD